MGEASIITVASVKGGVGKTTTAVSLAAALAQLEPTLLVDFDVQGQVSLHFGLPARSGVFHWLSRSLPLEECIGGGRPAGLRIMPGDSMTKALYNIYQGSAGSTVIGHHLQVLGSQLGVNYVVVDTAAGGLLQEAALLAAHHVVIPFRCEVASLDGLFTSVALVDQLNPNPIHGVTVLATDFDRRLREHTNNLLQAKAMLPGDCGLELESAIWHRIAVAEAVAYGSTIWEYNHGRGIEDVRIGYWHLACRILRLTGRDGRQQELLEAFSHG